MRSRDSAGEAPRKVTFEPLWHAVGGEFSRIHRDVIERHKVSNVTALRALQRHLLAAPGGSFTVNKFYEALHSQGVPVA